MLTILKTGKSAHKVPPEKVQATYGRYRIQALLSVFLGYLAYYYSQKQLHIIDALFKRAIGSQRYANRPAE